MKNLVSIEKKKYIFNQYVKEYDRDSVYDLVMELLDNSYFENGDIKEMVEVCEFCFSRYQIDYVNLEDEVKESHDDWLESNYTRC